MKVYIGPYKNWFGPYQLAEKICFWVKKDKFGSKPDWVYSFGNFLAHGFHAKKETNKLFDDKEHKTWLYKFLTWIDSKRERKVKIHIDEYDSWNAFETIALVVKPILIQLKSEKNGCAIIDDNDVPDELKTGEYKPSDDDSLLMKKYEYVLDQMIWSFEQVLIDWEDQYYSGECDLRSKELVNGSSEIFEGPNYTFKVDKEGLQKHKEKIDNGFRLFGKYFQTLWD